jgi:uncharacterized protein (DUF1697 family)
MKKIAFLRGINVGNIRIKMPDLQKAFEEIIYTKVSTLLATGNVSFESTDSLEKCKADIQKKLIDTFHYEAFALVYNASFVSQVLANCTLAETDESHLYVMFIEKPEVADMLKLASKDLPTTEIQFADGVMFWKVTKGDTLSTPFSKEMAKAKYKSSTTMRNINTVRKLVEV